MTFICGLALWHPAVWVLAGGERWTTTSTRLVVEGAARSKAKTPAEMSKYGVFLRCSFPLTSITS